MGQVSQAGESRGGKTHRPCSASAADGATRTRSWVQPGSPTQARRRPSSLVQRTGGTWRLLVKMPLAARRSPPAPARLAEPRSNATGTRPHLSRRQRTAPSLEWVNHTTEFGSML